MEFHWDKEFKETRRQVVQDISICRHYFLQKYCPELLELLVSMSPLLSPCLLKKFLYG
jgi:hypothetical protein